jgi:hypothetical protein
MLFVDLFQKGQQYSIHTVKALVDSSCKWGPKGLTKRNRQLLWLIMTIPGGILSQYWKLIEHQNDVLKRFSTILSGGYQSAGFQSWLQAVQRLLRLKGLNYVNEQSLEAKKTLQDIIGNGLLRGKETDYQLETLESYFTRPSILQFMYDKDRDRILNPEVISLMLSGYHPHDPRSVWVADPVRLSGYLERGLGLYEIASVIQENQILDSGFVWGEVVDSRQIRLFAATAKKLVSLQRGWFKHFRLVGREDLPAVIQPQCSSK